MTETLCAQLIRSFSRRGIGGQAAVPLAVAVLVAAQEDRVSDDIRSLFEGLANRLKPQFAGDASELAADWLSDPGLSSLETEAIGQGLAFLRSNGAGPIDWSAELATVLAGPFSYSLSLPVSKAIARAINLPIMGTCACLFPGSASIAWVLSADREVTLFPADRDLSIILTLFARAACRPLRVNRRNPINGSHMRTPYAYESPDHRPPFEAHDFLISAPPFGQRVLDGESKGAAIEVLQAQHFIPLARRSFTMLVTDGVLFRESRFEIEFRQHLVSQYGIKVTSLPAGLWGRASVQTSLVTVRPDKRGLASFVDGRTMGNAIRHGREQEASILQHLDMLEDAPSADVPVEELASNAYNLSVSRYVLSGDVAQVEAALANRDTARLSEVARIIRPKAPLAARGAQEPQSGGFIRPKGMPNRSGSPAHDLVRALEITPSDIVDGHVEMNGREVFFDAREAARLGAVRIETNDILVSIKGNIGVVGLVGNQPDSCGMDDPPWIVSQSLAIIRTNLGSKLRPALLNAILTAPAAKAQMQRLAGGSTVPTLSIGTLKDLEIPLPDKDEAGDLCGDIEGIEELRKQIDKLSGERTSQQRRLWAKLWNLPYEFGEE